MALGQLGKVELFPFAGDESNGTVHPTGRLKAKGKDWTSPGEWPLDFQCVLELPADLAERVSRCLAQAERGSGGDSEELEMEIKLDDKAAAKSAAPEGRLWRVKVWGEELKGTLVDLPCHTESHLLPPSSADDSTGVLYKSADITQMLIVHREDELPNKQYLDTGNYMWRCGLTPPTHLITQRRFRGVPPPESMFAAAHVKDAVSALKDRISNLPFTYEEEVEVDEAFIEQLRKDEPGSIWNPPAEVLQPPAKQKRGSGKRPSSLASAGSGTDKLTADGGQGTPQRRSSRGKRPSSLASAGSGADKCVAGEGSPPEQRAASTVESAASAASASSAGKRPRVRLSIGTQPR